MNDSRVRPVAVCYSLATIIVLYWVAWFSHRSLVASESSPVYVSFEQAFPVADGFIVLFLLLSARALRRRSSSAVLFLLLGAGAGFYLGGMDALYDVEHGIWSRGSNGLVELAINVVTFAAAALLTRWVWAHRRELDHVAGEGGGAGQ
jgi:hypothetical protein